MLFAGCLAFVLLAQVTLITVGFTLTRLWEDEAYNLTVALNLVQGRGYASDGFLTTGQLDPFDHRISTGPVVILPIALALATGIDPVLGARLVLALFYLALLGALYLLGVRASGRWGGLIAAAMPLALNTLQLPSPLQGPTDILGEVPAALFLALFVLLFRAHPGWAGLAIGLAFESKMLVVLVILAALAAVVLVPFRTPVIQRLRRGGAFLALAAAPVLAFELAKLLSLGGSRYLASTRDLYYFLLAGGQSGFSVSVLEKILTVLSSWFLPWFLVAAVVLLWAVLLAVVVSRGIRNPVERRFPVPAELLVLLAFLVIWLGWWTIGATQPAWIRHPSPALLTAVPVLAAYGLAAARVLWSTAHRPVLRSLAALGVAALIGVPAGAHVVSAFSPRETLADQRSLAAAVRALPDAEVRGWWGSFAPIAVLAGKRGQLVEQNPDASSPILINSGADAGPDTARQREHDWCGDVLLQRSTYVVCSPKAAK